MNRAVNITQGTAFVVTDLHGSREAYMRYRDRFLTLRARGEADVLIFLGDVIHGYGPPEEDYSLPVLLDIMDLQEQLGRDTVIMLLGNHELPHIYGFVLSKGDITFTPRFEHALGEYRTEVLNFLKSLPFLVRTAGGTLLTHAGASPTTATPEAASWLLGFSHDALLSEASALLKRADVHELLEKFGVMSAQDYERMAWEYLAANPVDARYLDLLRGFVVSNLEPEWTRLWEYFFTTCEAGVGDLMYGRVLERFLHVYSAPEMPQKVMVTGHIPVEGGCAVIAEKQLRLASWTHATPRSAGHYLLFDVAQPVETAHDLLPFVYPLSG